MILRTIIGAALGIIGLLSFFGTLLMIATGDGNLLEDIGIPVGISIVFIIIAMAIAPWLF